MSPQQGLLNNFYFLTKANLSPHVLTSRAFSISPSKAGLLTSLHSKAPSRPDGQWLINFRAIREHTAAGQSETYTPFPINRG